MSDLAVNQLFGGTGSDWFWFSDSSKFADQLSGFIDGEVLSF
jgi:hypothetical protein